MIEVIKLFTKHYSRKSREWELRRTHKNLRIEYKMIIERKDFETFEEPEDLGKDWKNELAKLYLYIYIFEYGAKFVKCTRLNF